MDPTPVAPIIDPQKVPMLIAAGMGAFLSMLFNRGADKLTILTTLVTAEVTAYYFAQPAWAILHSMFSWANEDWRGSVALSIGLLAIFIVGGIVKMAQDFWAAPWKTIGEFAVSIIQRFIPKKGGE